MGKGGIMYGLSYIPSIKENDRDAPYRKIKVKQEFSEKNHSVLKYYLRRIKNCNFILEIGVSRNGDKSSTNTLLKYKKKEAIYLGIDLVDKSFLKADNCYTLKTNSSNTEEILNEIKKLSGKTEIDFLMIDGFHSVNQILDDWKFSKYVTKNGVIAIHDINHHPGPIELIKAIDKNLFEIRLYHGSMDQDWGIGVVRRKSK